jgi:DNA-binding response OmpR family regulator/curved DNA-binding protein CbpA
MPPYLLVVESDPTLAAQIGEALREAGYELSTEAEGAWARRSLLVRPPDAVVLDTGLSDGSGFAVADALRKDADTRNAPIFFIASRYRGQAHRTEARRRYAPAEYFTTPLDLNSLLAGVLEKVPPKDPATPVPVPSYPTDKIVDTAQKREKREVEQAAREITTSRPRPQLRGSLAREPFARLLRRMFVERRTGALLLARDGIKKIVYFRDGYPISVRSNVLGECLGQVLLKQNLISKRALDESLRRMKEDRKQQGQLLVQMGALSPYNLERALRAQMESKLYDLFRWRSGTFSFTEGREAPGEPVRLEKTPAALILEGIRMHYDAERQRAALAPFAGHYIAPSADPLRRLQEITSDPAERRFVEGLDGVQRLEAALSNAPIPLAEARLLVVAMAEAGMVEPSRTPARRGVDESASGVPIEEWVPTFDRTPDRKNRDELLAVLEAMRARTHFEVLGLSDRATAAEVARAYELRGREYHPDRFMGRPDDVRQVALKIFDRLGEAHATLADPARRKRYAARLERERSGDGSESGLAQAPSSAAEKMYYAGVEHLRSRRYREAIETFRQAIALAPRHAGYHGALGWAIYRAAPGDGAAIGDGLAALRRAVELDPQDAWIRISLGRFFAETGRADEAVAELQAALALNPGLTDIEDEIRRLRGEA